VLPTLYGVFAEAKHPAPSEDVRASSRQRLAIRTDQAAADHPAPSR